MTSKVAGKKIKYEYEKSGLSDLDFQT
ncbi:hypothetical protein B4U80_06648 [Leptotrombidium deliense]|uniref:Uncharacterized protein n=1 Tax=Leptotrombidium deliense TaxID=299467 RepID=A0A443RWG1_9ACAR|nr:hypothetical protein B4U80_06648 [Leptotrombidium deliense]